MLLEPGSPSDFLPKNPPNMAKFRITSLIVGIPSGSCFFPNKKEFLLNKVLVELNVIEFYQIVLEYIILIYMIKFWGFAQAYGISTFLSN